MVNRGLMAAALLSTLAISGCATWDDVAAQQGQRYVGRPVDAMYGEWGAPINSAPLSGGGYFYEFDMIRAIYHCQAKAWTDPGRIVRQIQVGGQNGCLTG